MKTYALQDLTKQSGNNLLDAWGEEWDAEPGNAWEFETKEEAEEFINKHNLTFAGVVEL